MRVLVAPDKFAGTLTADQAAAAIAEGWQQSAPHDDLTTLPMADGGPGFADALHAALGGTLEAVVVAGPRGTPVPVTLVHVGDVVYLESAQACGLHLLTQPDPWHATSRGVGEAIAAAVAAGARTVVVGLGGSGTNDGGAGLLAGLGATVGAASEGALDQGPEGLRQVSSVDLAPALAAVEGVRLVAATDVDVRLLGLFGATKGFGAQKGLSEPEIVEVDALLDRWVDVVCGPTPAERRVADAPGAGAAGGVGFALLLLGAEVSPGVGLVADAVGLADACSSADLVVTGEGMFDHSSRSGKAVFGVAEHAAAAARPCIVLAGQVTIGSREMRAMGVESAYAAADVAGLDASMDQPRESLVALAARAARTWSPPARA